MPQTSIKGWLQFAIQQVAAESYLDSFAFQNSNELIRRLRFGNNNAIVLGLGNPDDAPSLSGQTRLTAVQAEVFSHRYQIIDHHANDATGFSATLMKDTTAGQYTLSFRSSEYAADGEGGDRARDIFGADTEIKNNGFAFAQLVSMERYYRELQADPAKLPPGAVLNVTGFSLGGHLATVFTELHANEINQTYTFNGAGRGDFREGTVSGETQEAARIRLMVDDLDAHLRATDPMGTLFAEGSAFNIYQDERYQVALDAVKARYPTRGTQEIALSLPGVLGGIARYEGAFGKIQQLVGHAETGQDAEVVANSGIHGPATRILIEGQPLIEDVNLQDPWESQFGNSHSLTLLVDSLALQDLFQAIDPTLTQAQIEGIFRMASDAKADLVGQTHTAEGNTLELALDALRTVFVSPAAPPTAFNDNAGGFGDLARRNEFYVNLEAVRAAVGSQTYQLASFATNSSNEITAIARNADAAGLAYRFALRELNPFAIVGADYTMHNAGGVLDLYDPTTGQGAWTQMAIDDRAAVLSEKLKANLANGFAVDASETLYEDLGTGFHNGRRTSATEVVIFNGDRGGELTGRQGNDHIYGGDGADTISGGNGHDYLEGGKNGDVLYGERGSDILFGMEGHDELDGGEGIDRLDGGVGDDKLIGGAGTDMYHYRFGTDTIDDSDGKGVIHFRDLILKGGIRREGEPEDTYKSLDGLVTYTKDGTDLVVAGSEVLTIKNFVNGQFGIHLSDAAELAQETLPTIDVENGWEVLSLAGYPVDDTGQVHYISEIGRNVVLHALGGNDFISASGGGNDDIHGDDGHDVIHGQGGNDRLHGGTGSDQLTGDLFSLTVSDDSLDGDEGDDYLIGSAGHDILLGGGGNDTLYGDDQQFSVLAPGEGDDYLDGGEGDDRVRGDYGADTLLGGDGDDLLWGDYHWHQVGPTINGPYVSVAFDASKAAGDYLSGGAGSDMLYGDGGDDTLLGGAENDTLYGDFGESEFFVADGGLRSLSGDDYLDGETGDDVLYGGGGHDVLLGGDGNDELIGDDAPEVGSQPGQDWLEGGAGNDRLFGAAGEDALVGGEGNDLLVGDYANEVGAADTLDGGAGDDWLQGGGGDDLLEGGSGLDTLYGEDGDDVLYGGADNDQLLGGLGDDLLEGEEGVDVLYGQQGQDVLYGGKAGDFLYGDEGDDLLLGEEAADQLVGGSGADTLMGGADNDLLIGDAGNDTLLGEEGDDELQGGTDQDLLVGGGGQDRLFGQADDDQLVGEAGDDLLVGDAGDDQLVGGAGADQLSGGAGDDRMEGGVGDDLFEGGVGTDTYVFNLGDGVDTITDLVGEGNCVRFGSGISAESIRLEKGTGDTLVLRVGRTDDAVQIVGYGIDNPAGPHPIDHFEFADGTTMTYSQLVARGLNVPVPVTGGLVMGTLVNDQMHGSPSNDVLYGREGDDVLRGGSGTDYLAGEGGNDALFGDGGADDLNGGEGDDTLAGGEGDDRLSGGRGADVLAGDAGHDVLLGGDGNDQLSGGIGDDRLDAGTGADWLDGGVGNDRYVLSNLGQVVVETADGGVDTVQARFSGTPTYVLPDHVEQLEWLELGLEEGTNQPNFIGNALNNQLTGPGVLDGRTGDDVLIGTADNTYVFGRGYGQDVVRTGPQGYAPTGLDVVRFLDGIAPADVALANHANDLVITLNGLTDQLTLEGYFTAPHETVDQFLFADGTVWTHAEIMDRVRTFVGTGASDTVDGSAGDDTMQGMGGDDSLYGHEGHDVLEGGQGNDYLVGGVGHDTYLFARGAGYDRIDDSGALADVDVVQLGQGIAPGDVRLLAQANNDEVILTVRDSSDQLGLNWFNWDPEYRIDQIRFEDGTTWDYSTMVARVEGVTLAGTNGGETLYGTFANDTLIGLDGRDELFAGEGQDLLSGGAGDDFLEGGAGHDTLDGGTGADMLLGGAGNDLYVIDSVGDAVSESANQGTDTVQSGVTYTLGANVEHLTLMGTAAINGTGNSLGNTLIGNSASNILTGGAGNDTYVVGAGDTVVEAASAGTDMVQTDTTWTLGANVERLVLTGTVAVSGTGNSLANTLTGNSAANVLNGGTGADTMIGGQGDDTYVVDNLGDKTTELANEGVDTVQSSVTYTLAANVENLILTGASAINGTGNGLDNVLVGNSAANRLAGGAGNDTYVVGAGDTVSEGSNAGIDTVQSGITYTLGAYVENLTLTGTSAINGTGNSLDNVLVGNTAANTLTGGAGNDTYVVGAGDTVVEAANSGMDTVQSSVTWTLGANMEHLTLTGTAAIHGTGNALGNVLIGNTADNTLSGGDGNDTLSGGQGHDTLVGGAGHDRFQFGRGDGQDLVSESSGTADRLDFTSGINPVDLIISRSSDDLRIALYGSTDQVTVANWYGGAANQVETFQAGNGQQLVNTQVDQLIQAMAAFTQQSGLSWEDAVAQRPQDVQAVLAASWQ